MRVRVKEREKESERKRTRVKEREKESERKRKRKLKRKRARHQKINENKRKGERKKRKKEKKRDFDITIFNTFVLSTLSLLQQLWRQTLQQVLSFPVFIFRQNVYSDSSCYSKAKNLSSLAGWYSLNSIRDSFHWASKYIGCGGMITQVLNIN